MAGYVEAAEAYLRSRVERQSLDELAAKYLALDAMAVLLAWDAETATGRPRVPNSTVAAAVRQHPGAFTGIGSVDPHKESAVDEVAEIAALGLRGVKFHPSLQAFAPDDEKFWPVFAACEAHGLLALFHTGTSGIGARQPGGQGIRIDYLHPLKLDSVAAAFPGLTVVAAHFGWPWHMDLLAMALHKTNVYIDISGWSPRRIPAEVTRELKGRLADQFVWGSDYPFIAPERCLGELEELGLDSPVLLHDNAARILGLPALPSGLEQCERAFIAFVVAVISAPNHSAFFGAVAISAFIYFFWLLGWQRFLSLVRYTELFPTCLGSRSCKTWLAFAWARQAECAWRAFHQPPFTPHLMSERQSHVLLGSARLAQWAAADRPRARPAYISPSKAHPSWPSPRIREVTRIGPSES